MSDKEQRYRIENAVLESIPRSGYQLWRYGPGMSDVVWLSGPDQARARVGAIGRLVYNSSGRGGHLRFVPYGASLARFVFIGDFCPRPWRGVRAVHMGQFTAGLAAEADVIFRYRDKQLCPQNVGYWRCERNRLGKAAPRVFADETLWEILQVVIDRPPYTPMLGDTIIITADGPKGGAIKGAMTGTLLGDRRYRVQSFEDGKAYTGKWVGVTC